MTRHLIERLIIKAKLLLCLSPYDTVTDLHTEGQKLALILIDQEPTTVSDLPQTQSTTLTHPSPSV